MDTSKARELLKKYNKGECTDQERLLVEQTFMDFNEDAVPLSDPKLEKLRTEVFKSLPVQRAERIKLWVFASAAAVALIALAGPWLFESILNKPVAHPVTDEIMPGGNKAVLILVSGKRIELSGKHDRVVAAHGAVKYGDGTGITPVSITSQLQTLQTPRGGQYQLVLSDGTLVTLNAESSIRFPSDFKGAAFRRVSICGEAYFEVTKDKKHPFIVESVAQQVKVLGTHFNINAYDQVVRTTLAEGAVQVSAFALDKTVTLRPGESSVVSHKNISVVKADLATELAWRNGRTEFYDADIFQVMGMLERWYNIEADFLQVSADARFSASIPRSRSISEVLKMLESTGDVHFKIIGRRVLVTK